MEVAYKLIDKNGLVFAFLVVGVIMYLSFLVSDKYCIIAPAAIIPFSSEINERIIEGPILVIVDLDLIFNSELIFAISPVLYITPKT